jgi:hypothetical protein
MLVWRSFLAVAILCTLIIADPQISWNLFGFAEFEVTTGRFIRLFMLFFTWEIVYQTLSLFIQLLLFICFIYGMISVFMITKHSKIYRNRCKQFVLAFDNKDTGNDNSS